MDKLKKVILQKISEDKQKYSMKGRSRKEVVKTSVYDKLDWFEKYTMKKVINCCLNLQIKLHHI